MRRKIRHKRVRRKLSGTKAIPRLFVFRSNRYTYVQLIDDEGGRVLFSGFTGSAEFKDKIKNTGNIKAANELGKFIAAKVKDKGVEKIRFDRSGYKYHGRVKAVAEGAREGGLVF